MVMAQLFLDGNVDISAPAEITSIRAASHATRLRVIAPTTPAQQRAAADQTLAIC